ncbi:MAG: DUF4079 domain-containing protein, partial [Cyanobacteria bacterium J06638_6]
MTLDALQPWLNFVHPVIMWLLLATTLYALYLGVQARRTRLADAETRKELIKGKFALKHHQVGSVLLAFMVFGTVGGMGATYIEAGKLFVGPHLLAVPNTIKANNTEPTWWCLRANLPLISSLR